MEEINDIQQNENQIIQEINIIRRLLAIKDRKVKDELINSLNETKEKYLKSGIPENIIRGAILCYVSEYDPISFMKK